MAKEQNLSLNPTKISGLCDRLMCCLKYEQDQYEATRKKMPKVGKEVITPDGPGVVWELNVIKETVRVRIQKGDSSELKEYPMEDVQRPGAANNIRKEEPAAEAAPAQETAEQPRARKERPAREERKPRREGGEKAECQEKRRPQPEKPVEVPADEKPAEAPNAVPAAETEKPAVSSWKAALEKAMKEAGNNGNT
jgi:hypothetical protein